MAAGNLRVSINGAISPLRIDASATPTPGTFSSDVLPESQDA